MTRESKRESGPRPPASQRGTSPSARSMRTDPASSAHTARSAPTQDPNLRHVDQPPDERYFERRQIKEAIAFAEAGGIAIHRNFDYYHGSKIRGIVREKPFLHIIGFRAVLEEWGRGHRLRPEGVQPEKPRRGGHLEGVGAPPEALSARLKPRRLYSD